MHATGSNLCTNVPAALVAAAREGKARVAAREKEGAR